MIRGKHYSSLLSVSCQAIRTLTSLRGLAWLSSWPPAFLRSSLARRTVRVLCGVEHVHWKLQEDTLVSIVRKQGGDVGRAILTKHSPA